MMCLFKKWVPNVAGHFVPGTPGKAVTTQAETASDSATSTAR
jgi:hypothetical protein